MAKKEAEKVKESLFVPTALESKVLEGFEPLTVVNELIETHYLKIIDSTMSFDPKKT